MQTRTVLIVGALGVGGYFLWRYLQGQAAAALGASGALPSGLLAQINAGTYDASALRDGSMGMPAPSFVGAGGA